MTNVSFCHWHILRMPDQKQHLCVRGYHHENDGDCGQCVDYCSEDEFRSALIDLTRSNQAHVFGCPSDLREDLTYSLSLYRMKRIVYNGYKMMGGKVSQDFHEQREHEFYWEGGLL